MEKRRTRLGPVLLFVAALAIACGQEEVPALRLDETPLRAELIILPEPTPVPAPPPAATPLPLPLSGRRVCLDPGHDSYWVAGATGYTSGGTVPRHPADSIPLYEHELTLSVAYRVKELLEAQGAEVCVTRKPRDEGGGLQIEPYDFTGDGRVRTQGAAPGDGPERIQPRIDWANQFGAEVLVSLHFNGSENRSLRGSEVYYSDVPRHQEAGRRLGAAVLDGLLAEMKDAGWNGSSRGVLSDRYGRYAGEELRLLLQNNAAAIRRNGADPARCPDCERLLTTGNNPMARELGSYVGVVLEIEFLSNPAVVESFILRPDSLDIAARGVVRGIIAYFNGD